MSENVNTNAGASQSNGMATAGLILGIVGCVCAWIVGLGWLAWIAGILAIIFGAIGMSKAKKINGVGKKAGVAGLVLGILAIIFYVLSWMLIINEAADTLEANGFNSEMTTEEAEQALEEMFK